ncbi:sigma-54-dependent transcriptional regulator, partial [Oceanicola sp. S124]|uniref:sigma-54-dependent transcriptional regulator n=1 Tax=Oceanicola sp. S124 TaxID=1042378 RepID=UPI000255893A
MAEAKVLVVDDEPGLRHFLSKALSRECARVDVAEDTQQASACLDAESYDVIILDNIMPGQSGLSWLADQRQIGLHADVIIVTAFADLRTAIEAIQAGASDFLLKPFRSNQVLNAVSKCLSRADLSRQNSLLRHELEEGTDLMRHRSHLIGSSRATQAVRRRIEEAAGIDSNTIIQGEPGTPKLISARMLHSASARRGRPFITLQCYGMTAPDLRERLFGRLTAEEDAEGLLKLAEGGMLYLEEVDQLDASCQSVLLEWAAQGRFQPIGGRRSFASDIRIICSSTVPLARAVRSGAFRADLH